MSSQLVISESNIRNIAHNLKNLLKLAEKVNFPFKDVKYPVNLTILNGVCDHFGFSSVKGMSELLADDSFDPSTLEQQPINLMHGLRKSNPKSTDEQLYEAHIFIVSLFDDLLNHPVNVDTTKLISKVQAYQLNPVVSNVIDMIDTRGAGSFSATKEAIIKKAAQTIFLYNAQLHYWGAFEQYKFENFLKGEKTEGMDKFFPLFMDMVNSEYRIGSTESIEFDSHVSNAKLRVSFNPNVRFLETAESIEFDSQVSNAKLRVSFNPNVKFLETATLQLRKRLLLGLLSQPDTYNQTAGILRSLMSNKRIDSNELPTDKLEASQIFDEESDYLNDPLYAERVLRSICWANSHILKKLSLSNTEHDLSHYVFDANGLLTPKHFPTVYLSLFHVDLHTVNYKFENLNQLYWAIQLLSAEILQISGSHHDVVAAKYIRDIYSCYKFSAVVEEHALELQSGEFVAQYQKFRDSTFKTGYKAK